MNKEGIFKNEQNRVGIPQYIGLFSFLRQVVLEPVPLDRYLTPYDLCAIFSDVRWVVEVDDEFKLEFFELHEDVRTEILALSRLLQQFGPQLKRPRVDTLSGSRHPNMKELRFSAAGGEWRVAFAFDTKRKATLLAAGDKSKVSEKRFYRELIRRADDRFDAHSARLKRRK